MSSKLPLIILSALTALGCCFPALVHAQIAVSGHVQDTSGASVHLANVQLLAASNSSFVAGTLINEDGKFLQESGSPGPIGSMFP